MGTGIGDKVHLFIRSSSSRLTRNIRGVALLEMAIAMALLIGGIISAAHFAINFSGNQVVLDTEAIYAAFQAEANRKYHVSNINRAGLIESRHPAAQLAVLLGLADRVAAATNMNDFCAAVVYWDGSAASYATGAAIGSGGSACDPSSNSYILQAFTAANSSNSGQVYGVGVFNQSAPSAYAVYSSSTMTENAA